MNLPSVLLRRFSTSTSWKSGVKKFEKHVMTIRVYAFSFKKLVYKKPTCKIFKN